MNTRKSLIGNGAQDQMEGACGFSEDNYAEFLRVTEDGRIWWREADALRLAAGYRLVSDDHKDLVAVLRAPNNRVRANERTLLGAFSDDRLQIERPMTFERGGVHYVDASAFLGWLSQYLSCDQSGIPFPSELTRQVRMALAKSAAAAVSPVNGFVSLTLVLEDWFERPLADLPAALCQRVEQEFFPRPWADLTADQRRSVALQLDYQHDPATEQDRQFWWNFVERQHALNKQLDDWNSVAAMSAGDLAQKEARLVELRLELTRMEQKQKRGRSDYYPEQKRADDEVVVIPSNPELSVRYMAYPKAVARLIKRLLATPEELAAWVWRGPKDGGLAAYLNANELDPPPRFHYDNYGNTVDYLSPLMACWFREDDIATFEPIDRFITGKDLIERWSQQPGIQTEAFIRAKIAESRLLDAHPIYGGTQGTCPEEASFPPLSSGLFVLAQVEEIEVQDFGEFEVQGVVSSNPCQPVAAWQIKHHFQIIKNPGANDEWWKEMMREAKRNGLAECRTGEGKRGPGGSLWRPDLVAAWLMDRQGKDRQGLSVRDSRTALRKFPGGAEVADELFPADELNQD